MPIRFAIDQRVALQEARPGDDVLVLRSAGRSPPRREVEVVTVSDAAADS